MSEAIGANRTRTTLTFGMRPEGQSAAEARRLDLLTEDIPRRCVPLLGISGAAAEAGVAGAEGGVGAVRGVELGEDVGDVVGHGSGAQV